MITPEQWSNAERPALEETVSVYGVGGLDIVELGTYRSPEPLDNEFPDGIRFRAIYQKWEQPLTETVAYRIPDANSTVRLRVDELTLQFDGRYWLISEINRIEDELIHPSDFDSDES